MISGATLAIVLVTGALVALGAGLVIALTLPMPANQAPLVPAYTLPGSVAGEGASPDIPWTPSPLPPPRTVSCAPCAAPVRPAPPAKPTPPSPAKPPASRPILHSDPPRSPSPDTGTPLDSTPPPPDSTPPPPAPHDPAPASHSQAPPVVGDPALLPRLAVAVKVVDVAPVSAPVRAVEVVDLPTAPRYSLHMTETQLTSKPGARTIFNSLTDIERAALRSVGTRRQGAVPRDCSAHTLDCLWSKGLIGNGNGLTRTGSICYDMQQTKDEEMF